MGHQLLKFEPKKDLPSENLRLKKICPPKDLPSEYENDLRVANYSAATRANYFPVAQELEKFLSARAWSIENLSLWSAELSKRDLSPSTRALIFSAAISFLQFCFDRSVHSMPMDTIRRVLRIRRKEGQSRTRWRGIGAVSDLAALEGALNSASTSDAAAVSLTLHCGLRASGGEKPDLKVKDVAIEPDGSMKIELVGKGWQRANDSRAEIRREMDPTPAGNCDELRMAFSDRTVVCNGRRFGKLPRGKKHRGKRAGYTKAASVREPCHRSRRGIGRRRFVSAPAAPHIREPDAQPHCGCRSRPGITRALEPSDDTGVHRSELDRAPGEDGEARNSSTKIAV